MLTQMELALLKARNFGEPVITRLNERDVVATAFKQTPDRGLIHASALGRNPEDAARKLVAVVSRP